MKIGAFTKTEDGAFEGRIETITFSADVRFLPVTEKPNPDMPDFRIVSTNTNSELGAGWFKKAQKSGKNYISNKIDDPSFSAPMWSALCTDDNGEYSLYWDRPLQKSELVTDGEKESF